MPGPTDEALAIARAAEPKFVNNRTYDEHGIPAQDTLAPHQACAPAVRWGAAAHQAVLPAPAQAAPPV